MQNYGSGSISTPNWGSAEYTAEMERQRQEFERNFKAWGESLIKDPEATHNKLRRIGSYLNAIVTGGTPMTWQDFKALQNALAVLDELDFNSRKTY